MPSERLLRGGLPEQLKPLLVEVLFDYRPTEWFRPATVLVLGAGVAGLACAYELGKAGYDCTVLEARDRVGGRNLTLRGGDAVTELPAGSAEGATAAKGSGTAAGGGSWTLGTTSCIG